MSTAGSRGSDRDRLRAIAVRAMRARGLDPNFPPDALAEAAALDGAAQSTDEPTRDLRSLLWCSIDNDDSLDLDQLTVAVPQPNGDVKIIVAVADVDATVKRGSAIDRHAAQNTTSVYTPAITFPMLPAKLSTDLTSLADHQERVSIAVEFTVAPDGSQRASDVYGARVKNYAKLAYRTVGAWLAGQGPLPAPAAAVAGMADQLKIQDRAAQALNRVRHDRGALDFATDDVEHLFDGDSLREVRPATPNRARDLIENLMIAANGVVARFLEARSFPVLRRVVRTP